MLLLCVLVFSYSKKSYRKIAYARETRKARLCYDRNKRAMPDVSEMKVICSSHTDHLKLDTHQAFLWFFDYFFLLLLLLLLLFMDGVRFIRAVGVILPPCKYVTTNALLHWKRIGGIEYVCLSVFLPSASFRCEQIHSKKPNGFCEKVIQKHTMFAAAHGIMSFPKLNDKEWLSHHYLAILGHNLVIFVSSALKCTRTNTNDATCFICVVHWFAFLFPFYCCKCAGWWHYRSFCRIVEHLPSNNRRNTAVFSTL